jgi:hypothetical protein
LLNEITPILQEHTFFDLKYRIVTFEIKFKALKEEYECITESVNSANDLLVNNQYATTNNNSPSKTTVLKIVKPVYEISPIKTFPSQFCNTDNYQDDSHQFKENYPETDYFVSKCNLQINEKPNKNLRQRKLNENYQSTSSNHDDNDTVIRDHYHSTPITYFSKKREQKQQQQERRQNELSLEKHTESNQQRIKIEMCDKMTNTINDMATQTEKQFQDLEDMYELHSSSHNFNESRSQEDMKYELSRIKEMQKRLKYKSEIESNNRESDGKQLLLEAYLTDNHKITNSSLCSSRKASKNKMKNRLLEEQDPKSDLINTRESGIGTMFEDEPDSTQSIHVDEEILQYQNQNESAELNINKLPSDTSNNSDDLDTNKRLNKDKRNRNFFKRKLNKVKQLKTASSSMKTYDEIESEENENSIEIKFKAIQKSASKLVLNESEETDSQLETSAKRNMQNAQNSMNNGREALNENTFSFFSVFKKIFTFLLILLPLLILLSVYFFYVYFLNPSCCDFQRNYLFINVS